MANNYSDNAAVFKALADENRLKILELLRQGKKCGNELLDAVQIGQSTLSHHMKVMCASGIVRSHKEGTWTYYSISPEGALAAKKLLGDITSCCDEDNTESKTVEPKFTEAAPEKSEKAEEPVAQHGSRPNGWLL
jgi:ArsR family transcriptional regulator